MLLVAGMLNAVVLAAPASAGDCSSPGCGGEVSNNTNYYVSISNCWESAYGLDEPGDDLPCHGNPVRVGNVDNARMWLGPGGWSSSYNEYYDTDAVKLPAGCVIKYHYWGLPQRTEDRRGKPSIWWKIYDIDHFYYDNITC
jgi:hypothetical protein